MKRVISRKRDKVPWTATNLSLHTNTARNVKGYITEKINTIKPEIKIEQI